MYGGKDKYVGPEVLKLNIVNSIPRAQSLKNGSSYPTLPYMYMRPNNCVCVCVCVCVRLCAFVCVVCNAVCDGRSPIVHKYLSYFNISKILNFVFHLLISRLVRPALYQTRRCARVIAGGGGGKMSY